MKHYLPILTSLLLFAGNQSLFAHANIDNTVRKVDSTAQHISQLPNHYFEQVNKKAGQLQRRLTKQSQKALKKVTRQEEKMRRKLAKVDSLAAHNIFIKETSRLQDWQNHHCPACA